MQLRASAKMPEDEPGIDDESPLYRALEPKGQHQSGQGEKGIDQQPQGDKRIQQGEGTWMPFSKEEISGSIEHDP